MSVPPKPKPLVIAHGKFFAPGDVVVLTGLVRDLARTYPGRYALYASTACPAVWANNPYCRPASALARDRHPAVTYYVADYGAGMRASRREVVHYAAWSRRDFAAKLQVEVPVLEPYPDLHLGPDETEPDPRCPPGYWLVCAGGKRDAETKLYPADHWREVLIGLHARGVPVVRAGHAADKHHVQPTLDVPGVIDLVGRTTLRGLFRLIAHAAGVVCHVSLPMHVAAAFQRPCVVLGGAREARHWEAYERTNAGLVCPERLAVPHRYLATNDAMPCCRELGLPHASGCWRSKLHGPSSSKTCLRVVTRDEIATAECLDRIRPGAVLEAIDTYRKDRDP